MVIRVHLKKPHRKINFILPFPQAWEKSISKGFKRVKRKAEKKKMDLGRGTR